MQLFGMLRATPLQMHLWHPKYMSSLNFEMREKNASFKDYFWRKWLSTKCHSYFRWCKRGLRDNSLTTWTFSFCLSRRTVEFSFILEKRKKNGVIGVAPDPSSAQERPQIWTKNFLVFLLFFQERDKIILYGSSFPRLTSLAAA